MKFKTKSGSIYTIDAEGVLTRTNDSKSLKDAHWGVDIDTPILRDAELAFPLEVGRCAFIVATPDGVTDRNTLRTTEVTEIIEAA